MTQTVIQIGNSIGVVIPQEVKKKLGLKKGSKVMVDITPDSKGMVITKSGASMKSSLTPEFLQWLENVNKEYGPALEELARK